MSYKFVLTSEYKGAYELPHDPDGWDGLEFSLVRGLEYHGLFYEQDAQLTFLCSAGKEYIDSIYDTYGIDALINIDIQQVCNCIPPSNANDYSDDYSDDYGSLQITECQWESVYTGVLDLKTIEIYERYTKCNIKQTDFFTKVRNRLDTKVDITSNLSVDGEAISVVSGYNFNMHTYPLVLKTTFERVDDFIQEQFPIYRSLGFCGHRCSVQVPFVFKKDNSMGYCGEQYFSLVKNNDIASNFFGGWTFYSQADYDAQDKSKPTYQPHYFQNGQESPRVDIIKQYPYMAGFVIDGNGNLVQDPASQINSIYHYDNYLYKNESELPITISITLRLKYEQVLQTLKDVNDSHVQWRLLWLVGNTYEEMVQYYGTDYSKWPLNNYENIASYNFADSIGVLNPFPVDIAIQRDIVVYPYQKFTLLVQFENYCLDKNFESSVVTINFQNIELWDLDITFTSVYEPTSANVYNIHDVGKQISRSITSKNENVFSAPPIGNIGQGYSANGCASFSVLTNGFGLRQFPINEKPLTISMNDYYRGLDPMLCLGLGIELYNDEYRLVIDDRSVFYDNTIILSLDNVPDIKRSIANEYTFNQIFIGYENYRIEDYTGLDEFNSQREYTMQVFNTENQLNAISTFTAGQYTIELCRRKNYKKSFVDDTEWDEQYFFIAHKRGTDGGGVPNQTQDAEQSEFYSGITDIINYQYAYNLRYSPVRNLIRWFRFLSGSILKNNKELKFQKGYSNYIAGTIEDGSCGANINGVPVYENQTFTNAYLTANVTPIFIPEYLEFTFPLSFADFKLLRQNPYKAISINNGYELSYKGYIIDIKYKPTTGIATFKLLRAYES